MPAKQERLSAKSPSESNGQCPIATNPKVIHTMTKIGFTRGTPMITTALGEISQKKSLGYEFLPLKLAFGWPSSIRSPMDPI